MFRKLSVNAWVLADCAHIPQGPSCIWLSLTVHVSVISWNSVWGFECWCDRLMLSFNNSASEVQTSLEESGRENQLGCIIELARGTQISLSVSERPGSILFTENFQTLQGDKMALRMKWTVTRNEMGYLEKERRHRQRWQSWQSGADSRLA